MSSPSETRSRPAQLQTPSRPGRASKDRKRRRRNAALDGRHHWFFLSRAIMRPLTSTFQIPPGVQALDGGPLVSPHACLATRWLSALGMRMRAPSPNHLPSLVGVHRAINSSLEVARVWVSADPRLPRPWTHGGYPNLSRNSHRSTGFPDLDASLAFSRPERSPPPNRSLISSPSLPSVAGSALASPLCTGHSAGPLSLHPYCRF